MLKISNSMPAMCGTNRKRFSVNFFVIFDHSNLKATKLSTKLALDHSTATSTW